MNILLSKIYLINLITILIQNSIAIHLDNHNSINSLIYNQINHTLEFIIDNKFLIKISSFDLNEKNLIKQNFLPFEIKSNYLIKLIDNELNTSDNLSNNKIVESKSDNKLNEKSDNKIDEKSNHTSIILNNKLELLNLKFPASLDDKIILKNSINEISQIELTFNQLFRIPIWNNKNKIRGFFFQNNSITLFWDLFYHTKETFNLDNFFNSKPNSIKELNEIFNQKNQYYYLNTDILFFQSKDELFYIGDKIYSFKLTNRTLIESKIKNTKFINTLFNDFEINTIGYLILSNYNYIKFYNNNNYKTYLNIYCDEQNTFYDHYIGKFRFLNNLTLIYVYQSDNETIEFIFKEHYLRLKLNLNEFSLGTSGEIHLIKNDRNQFFNYLDSIDTGIELVKRDLNSENVNENGIININLSDKNDTTDNATSKIPLDPSITNLTTTTKTILENSTTEILTNFTTTIKTTTVNHSSATPASKNLLDQFNYFIYAFVVVFISIISLVALYFFKSYSEKNFQQTENSKLEIIESITPSDSNLQTSNQPKESAGSTSSLDKQIKLNYPNEYIEDIKNKLKT